MNRTEELAYWITEREEMRRRYIFGKPVAITPAGHIYSADNNMALVRYCNVRREDDKVTKWLATHWRPRHHSAWELVLARMVNYIPTLEVLVSILDNNHHDPLARVAYHMKGARGDGLKIWTSAYTISTCGKSMDKVDYVMGVVQRVKMREIDWSTGLNSVGPARSLSGFHGLLMEVDGLGSFLAAQVVADMKNTQGHPLQSAPDWYTWSAHGPGSLKGLEAYFRERVLPSGYHRAIAKCWEEVRPLLAADLQDLHMQDFQNCLCEFSKYIRIKEGGHARNRYPSR